MRSGFMMKCIDHISAIAVMYLCVIKIQVSQRRSPIYPANNTGNQNGTCTRSLKCLRLATIVNVMITSNDHELHLPKCTVDQAPN